MNYLFTVLQNVKCAISVEKCAMKYHHFAHFSFLLIPRKKVGYMLS